MKIRYLKPKNRMMTGIGHYTPEEYQKLLKISDDVETMCDTWEELQARTTELMNVLKSRGLKTQKIFVDVEHLRVYLAQRGLKNTGQTRATYIQGIVSGLIKL
jgi:hypothetical protein